MGEGKGTERERSALWQEEETQRPGFLNVEGNREYEGGVTKKGLFEDLSFGGEGQRSSVSVGPLTTKEP